MYMLMEATISWPHLPRAGGLEDQDQMLMENIFNVAATVRKMRTPRT